MSVAGSTSTICRQPSIETPRLVIYDAFALYLQSGIPGRRRPRHRADPWWDRHWTEPPSSRTAQHLQEGAALCQRGLYNVGATMASSTRIRRRAGNRHPSHSGRDRPCCSSRVQQYKTPDLIIWTTVFLLVALFIVQIFASGVDDDTASADAAPIRRYERSPT